MRTGTIGEIARDGTAFIAEVRGLAHALSRPQGRLYPVWLRCRARRCALRRRCRRSGVPRRRDGIDGRFGIAIRGRRPRRVRRRLVRTRPADLDDGANAGRRAVSKSHRIAAISRDVFELWQPAMAPIAAGRRLHGHRRMRQAVLDLPRQVCQRRQFSRLPAHARQRFRGSPTRRGTMRDSELPSSPGGIVAPHGPGSARPIATRHRFAASALIASVSSAASIATSSAPSRKTRRLTRRPGRNQAASSFLPMRPRATWFRSITEAFSAGRYCSSGGARAFRPATPASRRAIAP